MAFPDHLLGSSRKKHSRKGSPHGHMGSVWGKLRPICTALGIKHLLKPFDDACVRWLGFGARNVRMRGKRRHGHRSSSDVAGTVDVTWNGTMRNNPIPGTIVHKCMHGCDWKVTHPACSPSSYTHACTAVTGKSRTLSDPHHHAHMHAWL